MAIDIRHGDCLEVMRTLPDCSVDSIVTDPPYGLAFMGKRWDYDVPSVEVWQECLRVLKPGGHLLAFAGTRTQHRMAVRIEDAGLEIRDMIAWVYGSGFPKSLDVSKAIDKAAGVERDVVGPSRYQALASSNRQSSQGVTYGGTSGGYDFSDVRNITAPATEAARQWQGWGTALKPALEPITMARKPLCGTVAENVLTHGAGAINVDGCRVGMRKRKQFSGAKKPKNISNANCYGDYDYPKSDIPLPDGRFPANLIHDGSEEVMGLFPNDGDSTAARFFYCPKADQTERGNGNNHPTVKPVDLMRYLVRLVTREGGTVLEPFGGSGTTAVACVHESCNCIIIERESQYVEIIKQRIAKATQQQRLF